MTALVCLAEDPRRFVATRGVVRTLPLRGDRALIVRVSRELCGLLWVGVVPLLMSGITTEEP